MRWKALLLDVDGTLCFRGSLIPGADGALAEFRQRGLVLRFTTNIDSRPPESVAAQLRAMGLDVRAEEVFSPPLVALRLMRADPARRWHCLVTPELQAYFGRPSAGEGHVDYVLLGYCPHVDYRMLNEAFRHILAGAELVALQKGRYFFTPDGINLDTGAVAALLEYACGIQARVLGKPSREFFAQCLADLGLHPEEVAVVGDDPASDVAGARAVGAYAVQVRTGKGSLPHPERDEDRLPAADLTIDSVADLLKWL